MTTTADWWRRRVWISNSSNSSKFVEEESLD